MINSLLYLTLHKFSTLRNTCRNVAFESPSSRLSFKTEQNIWNIREFRKCRWWMSVPLKLGVVRSAAVWELLCHLGPRENKAGKIYWIISSSATHDVLHDFAEIWFGVWAHDWLRVCYESRERRSASISNTWLIASFYSASALLAMQSAVLARGILSVRLSVCPSVRPSRSGIVSRRMKIRSCGFQHLVGQSL